ncbi:MAG: 50S ribosomal protein L22 [Actinomycetota bacterium]
MAAPAVQTYKAGARFIRTSPYKVRAVAELIRGKHVDEVRRILAFTPKAASRDMSKVLESAIANAEHNFSVSQDELYVRLVRVDEGVTIKRFRPRAQGRAYRIRKRTSHINLELERRVPQPQPPRRPATSATSKKAGGSTKKGAGKPGSKASAGKAGAKSGTKAAAGKPGSKADPGKASTSKASTSKAAAGKATASKRKSKEGS